MSARERAAAAIMPTVIRRGGLHGEADVYAALDAIEAAGLMLAERPEHAALADGTVLRDRTARDLGITNHSDEARWTPPPDPDDLPAHLDCGCDPDQDHHTCQRREP